MAHRDFDAEREDRGEGVTFKLGGRTFHTLPAIPAGALRRAGENQGVEQLCQWIEDLLVPEDVDAWRELVDPDNKDVLVEARDVAAISTWIVEELTERPTGRPSESSDGPRSADSGSEVASR